MHTVVTIASTSTNANFSYFLHKLYIAAHEYNCRIPVFAHSTETKNLPKCSNFTLFLLSYVSICTITFYISW